MDLDRDVALLQKSRPFKGCDAEKLRLLAFTAIPLRFAPGELLLSEGETIDHVLFVAKGQAETSLESDGKRVAIGPVGERQLIGLAMALSGRPSLVRVQAVSEVEALSLPYADLRRFLLKAPDAALALLEEMAERVETHISTARQFLHLRGSAPDEA